MGYQKHPCYYFLGPFVLVTCIEEFVKISKYLDSKSYHFFKKNTKRTSLREVSLTIQFRFVAKPLKQTNYYKNTSLVLSALN